MIRLAIIHVTTEDGRELCDVFQAPAQKSCEQLAEMFKKTEMFHQLYSQEDVVDVDIMFPLKMSELTQK